MLTMPTEGKKLGPRNLSAQSYAVADLAAHLAAPAGTLGYHTVQTARPAATHHGLDRLSHARVPISRGTL